MSEAGVAAIAERVVTCRRCPELRAYCAQIARAKKVQYREWTYWGKPVPAFGDPAARVALVGLAPGAHGSNRTGRMFTGDASGVWLYRALHRAGFSNQAYQQDRNDGLRLRDTFITAALHCAPPRNKPTPLELENCFEYLHSELAQLHALQVVVGLGAIGTRAARRALEACGYRFDRPPGFAHLAETGARHPRKTAVVLLASADGTYVRRGFHARTPTASLNYLLSCAGAAYRHGQPENRGSQSQERVPAEVCRRG